MEICTFPVANLAFFCGSGFKIRLNIRGGISQEMINLQISSNKLAFLCGSGFSQNQALSTWWHFTRKDKNFRV